MKTYTILSYLLIACVSLVSALENKDETFIEKQFLSEYLLHSRDLASIKYNEQHITFRQRNRLKRGELLFKTEYESFGGNLFHSSFGKEFQQGVIWATQVHSFLHAIGADYSYQKRRSTYDYLNYYEQRISNTRNYSFQNFGLTYSLRKALPNKDALLFSIQNTYTPYKGYDFSKKGNFYDDSPPIYWMQYYSFDNNTYKNSVGTNIAYVHYVQDKKDTRYSLTSGLSWNYTLFRQGNSYSDSVFNAHFDIDTVAYMDFSSQDWNRHDWSVFTTLTAIDPPRVTYPAFKGNGVSKRPSLYLDHIKFSVERSTEKRKRHTDRVYSKSKVIDSTFNEREHILSTDLKGHLRFLKYWYVGTQGKYDLTFTKKDAQKSTQNDVTLIPFTGFHTALTENLFLSIHAEPFSLFIESSQDGYGGLSYNVSFYDITLFLSYQF